MISNVNNNLGFGAKISRETMQKMKKLTAGMIDNTATTQSGHIKVNVNYGPDGNSIQFHDPQAKLTLFTLLGRNRKINGTVLIQDENNAKSSVPPAQLTIKEAQQRIEQIFKRVIV